MAHTQVTIVIDRSAEDILGFILDVQAYQTVDPRLRSIRWVRRKEGFTVFRFRPQLMGLPAPLSTQLVVRRGMRVDISALPSLNDRLARFAGSLACVEGVGGTTVTRTLRFDLARPLTVLLDRQLTRWLERDVSAEMSRLKSHLEGRRTSDISAIDETLDILRTPGALDAIREGRTDAAAHRFVDNTEIMDQYNRQGPS